MNYPFSISLFLITLMTANVSVNSSILTDCSEDPVGSLVSVTVKGCNFDLDPFCKFILGQDAKIDIKFRANQQLTQVKLKMAAIFGPVSIPVPFPDDACRYYNLTCPIRSGDEQTFALAMPVKSTYPKVDLDLQLKLINQDVEQIACVMFPAQVVEN